MKPKYMLNLIHANVQNIASQLEDNSTFMPSTDDAGSTEVYTEQERKMIMAKMQMAQAYLAEVTKMLNRCIIAEVNCG